MGGSFSTEGVSLNFSAFKQIQSDTQLEFIPSTKPFSPTGLEILYSRLILFPFLYILYTNYAKLCLWGKIRQPGVKTTFTLFITDLSVTSFFYLMKA